MSSSSSSSPTPSYPPSTSSLSSPSTESLLHPSAHPLRVGDLNPPLPSVVTEPLLPADSEEHGGSSDEERYRPLKRWVFPFPPSLDSACASIDDALIRLLQRPLNSVLRLPYIAFAVALTVFTAIEFGLVLPFSLYLVGADDLADLSTFLLLALSVISQVPKRFIWRARPWMVKRAIRVRKDKTSSFPSRAVTCAVVYGALLAVAISSSSSSPFPLILPICGLFAALAAAARVIVGAHYPSDCVVGLVAGVVITSIGWGMYAGEVGVCGACTSALDGGCYDRTSHPISASNIPLNWLVPALGVAVSSVVLALLACPPLYFWTKSSYVLGVLVPCIVFRLSFLCPPLNGGAALPEPSRFSGVSIGLALFVAAVSFGCAKVMNGLRGALNWLGFLALSGLLYVILGLCRVNRV